jgi:hypothetical protein
LEKDASEVNKIGITKSDYPELIQAKNRFYETCKKNSSLSSVNFFSQQERAIKKAFFENKIDRSKFDEFDFEYKLHELIITSPVSSAKSDAQWQGRDKLTSQNVYFRMEDNQFLFDFLNNGKYPIKESQKEDEITVLIKYKIHRITKKEEHSAVKVYRFNQIEIENIPEEFSVEVIERIKNKIPGNQQKLF